MDRLRNSISKLNHYVVVAILLLSAAPLTHAGGHEIGIQRKYSSQSCVCGYLLVDGKPICCVLERPWKNNIPLISSIPAGDYAAFIREDGPKGWRVS
jgi:Family of unknown function (DUF5675)